MANVAFFIWMRQDAPMNRPVAMRIAWSFGIVVTGLIFAHGIANLLGGGSFDSQADRTAYGSVQIVGGFFIATGLWVSARLHRGSMALVTAGVIAISAVMPWFVIFTIPVGLGLIGLAHSRRRVIRQ
jgi:hypothetical protein